MMDLLHSLRKWFELALVITIAGFLFIHFVLKPSSTITLPGGQVINVDTTSFNNAIKNILKKVDDQSKKINDLESEVRKQHSQVIEHDIPEALKETNITKSIQRMRASW
jgi:predicted DNA-binding antitoxin AbrB/MazE fold protein